MALIDICQDALQEYGQFDVPAAIVGNSTETAQTLLALANREIRTLFRRHHWKRLDTEHTFTTDASSSYGLPSDFDFILNDTVWDRTNDWPLDGPASPQDWQLLQGSTVTASLRLWWRIFQNAFYVFPSTDTGTTVAYEYHSSQPVESSGGTGQAKFLADSDVARIDEDLVTLGVKYRWLKGRGLAYDDEWNEYVDEVNKAIARDGGRRRVNMSETRPVAPLVNVPEGNFTL